MDTAALLGQCLCKSFYPPFDLIIGHKTLGNFPLLSTQHDHSIKPIAHDHKPRLTYFLMKGQVYIGKYIEENKYINNRILYDVTVM